VAVALGDWNGIGCKKGYVAGPLQAIKRRLKSMPGVHVVEIDVYYTFKYCSTCGLEEVHGARYLCQSKLTNARLFDVAKLKSTHAIMYSSVKDAVPIGNVTLNILEKFKCEWNRVWFQST
jgi:hypothetical protein